MNDVAARHLRILVVAAHEPWPLDHGGRLHLYHVLRELASAASVTLALTAPPKHAAQLSDSLETVVIPGVEAHSPPPEPWSRRIVARHFGWSGAIADWLSRHAIAERFDVVMLNGAVLGQYACACRVPVVWNLQDELVLPTLRAMRRQSMNRWPAMARAAAVHALFESTTMRRVGATILVSAIDSGWARTFAPFARTRVIENGVDMDYFSACPSAPAAIDPGAVTFVGALDFPPNIDAVEWFLATVWPCVRKQNCSVRFAVVGRDPSPELSAICGAAGVTLYANVPDVRPYLHAAGVIVVPVWQGGGLKNKILEACAAGRAVIATPQALGGLSARPDVDLIVARSRRAWANAVGALIRDPATARRIGTSAQRWVRARHDWSHTGRRFLAVLHAVAARRRIRATNVVLPVAGGAACP